MADSPIQMATVPLGMAIAADCQKSSRSGSAEPPIHSAACQKPGYTVTKLSAFTGSSVTKRPPALS